MRYHPPAILRRFPHDQLKPLREAGPILGSKWGWSAPHAIRPQIRHVDECPFVDLPQSKSSRWGGGVTADEMREMQWVKPELAGLSGG